jgi:ubiquitin-protein ligase
MIWYIQDLQRNRTEREAIEWLVASVDWIIPTGWRIDEKVRLIWDGDIISSARHFPVSLRYPNHFPHSPPLVMPRGEAERWSVHQYGPGGELCLEYGTDNWQTTYTGADMIMSAHRLLLGERPMPDQHAEVASRHLTTLGQKMRGKRARFVITRRLSEKLAKISEGVVLSGNAYGLFHENAYVNLTASITLEDGETWRDALPEPLELSFERPISVCRWAQGRPWPTIQSLSEFRAAAMEQGLDFPEVGHAIIIRGSEIRAYLLNTEEDRVFEVSVIPPEPVAVRQDEGHLLLGLRKVAIVGCGSLGSKLAATLARAGVGAFLLVDDDLLLPDNFTRHDLDWRDVGVHKADAVAARIKLVNPAAIVATWRHRLGGQESSGSVESLIEALSDCDLLVNATAEASAFNHLCASVTVGKKPLLWAEVFGGGFGGLIARHRPGIEPAPAAMRAIIEVWCAAQGKPLERSSADYGGSPDSPAIADDADVSVIAAHAGRMAIDLLIPREPSSFPNSVYLIGLAKGWIFEAPFETYPIDVGRPEDISLAANLSADEKNVELERIVQLFSEYQNAASPTPESDETTQA